jgi:DNA-binding protein Fis
MDLAQWERAMLEQALQQSAGNQTRAAQRLGISRDTLRYRLKKYGIGG